MIWGLAVLDNGIKFENVMCAQHRDRIMLSFLIVQQKGVFKKIISVRHLGEKSTTLIDKLVGTFYYKHNL